MNLVEYGLIIFEAQKASWQENDFEHFVDRLTQLIDHDVNEDDLETYRPEEKWVDKKDDKNK